MGGPLQGVRIIELAGFLSAPTACYMLGDLGAEVIKIEDRVKGDPIRGMSAYFGGSLYLEGGINIFFETANRNKKSVTLDLKKERGKKILRELVEISDVFCTNYSRKVCAKLGADYETLKQYNPELIYAIATGYGSRGPESGKRAFDPIAQARSGIMYSVGEPESPPSQINGPVFDQMTGTLLAYGILAALSARDRQGTGQQVEVSLLGSGIHLQAYNVNIALLRGRPLARASRKTLKNPLANYFQCGDGKWLMFAEAQSDRFWHDFCNALNIGNLEKDPRFATADERRKNFHEITSLIEEVFKTKTREEWIKILQAKGGGISFSPILSLDELSTDSQALENGYIAAYDHPVLGKVKEVGIPVEFSATPVKVTGHAPNFGEHTEDVLVNLCNYSWEEIEKLKNEEGI
jgi:crotonobetainyl-CoA:carnitine CoA-transferase CaiB-like acyl-CoA transferase